MCVLVGVDTKFDINRGTVLCCLEYLLEADFGDRNDEIGAVTGTSLQFSMSSYRFSAIFKQGENPVIHDGVDVTVHCIQ